jgi:hypothetical protein
MPVSTFRLLFAILRALAPLKSGPNSLIFVSLAELFVPKAPGKRGRQNNLMRRNRSKGFQAGTPRRLFWVPGAQPASNWDLAPDGKRFLFVTYTKTR